MRVLHLTNDEFDVLYDILVDTVSYLESDLITTSCALVLIKNGRLITLAIKCISAPIVADTCNTTK